jgi:hypothetical protein
MLNLPTYEQFLNEAIDNSKVSEIKKLVSEKLRTEVEYTESSGIFTCKNFSLCDNSILEDILKEIDVQPKKIKTTGFNGSTEFEIK